MTDQLCEVRLLGFPLAIHVRAQQHHTELMREFSLIALGEHDESAHTLPVRLRDLVDRLTHDYGSGTDEADLQRDTALAAGLESIDLTYHVPLAAAAASRELGEMLDEADEFCRAGDALLTLSTPLEARRFRDWYLQEFVGQLSGAAPVPWPDYAGTAVQDRP